MFVVKYDLQSMVKLIKCIEQHPLLYDTNHSDYSIRSEQDRAWKMVAKEVDESGKSRLGYLSLATPFLFCSLVGTAGDKMYY